MFVTHGIAEADHGEAFSGREPFALLPCHCAQAWLDATHLGFPGT